MSFTLRNIPVVDFDANNEEHLYAAALIDQDGRQHPTLRFAVEPPFSHVVHMVRFKIAEKVYQSIKEKYENSTSPDNGIPAVVRSPRPNLRVAQS